MVCGVMYSVTGRFTLLFIFRAVREVCACPADALRVFAL